MLGLPQSTEVNRPLPKAQIYKKFELKQGQRDAFDNDIARLNIVHLISPQTIPAVTEGAVVKAIFVVDVELKHSDYDTKNIALISKLIPQRIVFALRYGDKVQLAVFHTKLFVTPWQLLTTNSSLLTIKGLNLDAVWQNIVSSIGEVEVAKGNSLTEQIKADDERSKILLQLENLERQMRSTSQTRRQREIYAEIKKLKNQING